MRQVQLSACTEERLARLRTAHQETSCLHAIHIKPASRSLQPQQASLAGADSVVNAWPVEGGRLSSGAPSETLKLSSPHGTTGRVPAIRALTVSPLDEDIVLGTGTCDVIEVSTHQQVRVCRSCWNCSNLTFADVT